MRPEVWAPRARHVEVVLADGTRVPLVADQRTGWHRGGLELGPGDRYAFSLDGGRPRPDPRSAWQPEGIDGSSAVDDPTSFAWTDGSWRGFALPGAVLYELHVGTFTAAGTFDGAIERLDHLVGLGVDAVELLPVAEAMGTRGWGYDGVGLWAPHHAYGGPAAMRRFVDACHQRGLGVLLDVVYNHLGPQGNHLAEFGPYFSDRHHTPWGEAVNLDGPDASEVRRFIVDNATHWFVDHHIDGLRLDATHALLDGSPTHVVAELADATAALAAHLRRPLWLIAEREQEELLPVLAREAGGWGLDGRWVDDLHHALHAVLTGERNSYYAPFGSWFDVAAAVVEGHVRPGDDVPPEVSSHRFVVCSQNHDQIGNRAKGERLVHLVGADAAMAAAAVVLCAPGTPLLFQGEEWGASSPFPYFCDTDDAELAEAIRSGRRAEFAAFGWDPASIPDPLAPSTRDLAVLRWDERSQPDHARLLAWYRALLHLRRQRPDLTDGWRQETSVEVYGDGDDAVVVVHRAATAVVLNRSPTAQSVAVAGATELLLVSHDDVAVDPTTATVVLPPGATAVVAVSP